MIFSGLKDGHGTDHKLKINGEGEITASIHQHPPIDESLAAKPYRSYFVDSSGNNDMQVVGSAASPVVYSICASEDTDRYIKAVSIVIADASSTLNKFGNIAALGNGVLFEWITQDLGTVTLHGGLTSNWDFIRLAGGQPAFGDGAGAFRASNVSGTSEGYTPYVDFKALFGLAWGLRLRKGTLDCLRFVVRDDTTGVDQFDAIGYGTEV